MPADSAIPPLDCDAGERTRAAIDRKTKPPGSLGRLETLAADLARMQGTDVPTVDPARLYVCAGDHGIAVEGISAWPQEVTAQMVANFLAGGAAANAFARVVDCQIRVIDAGVASEVPDHPELLRAGIRQGTRNSLVEDALTLAEVEQAIAVGIREARLAADEGIRVLALGEMGIGNTSSTTLVAHAITGIPVRELAGPGAGLREDGLEHKIRILERAASRSKGRATGLAALQAHGGLEMAVMVGLAIGAAATRRTVLVDGFIATAAVLAAMSMSEAILGYCVFGHRSAERGHPLLLDWLNATPLLDLGLRLGEGTGALLALPILRAACAMRTDMSEFAEAGVSTRESG